MLAQMLGYAAALPALLSAIVLLGSWLLMRHGRPRSWPIALALVAGCTAGQIGVEGWRAFPPREAADRLFYLTLVAVLLSLLDDWRSWPAWLRAGVSAALWSAVVWFVLPPALRREVGRGELASWLAGLGLGGWIFWALLSLTARRSPGVMLPIVLLIVSAGTAGVLYRGHSITLTQLAVVLIAALVPVLVRGVCRPAVVVPAAPVMVLLPGLWLRSLFYDYDPPPARCFLLLAAAALAGALALLPGIRSLAAWNRCLLCAGVAMLLAVGAVLLARDGAPAEDSVKGLSPPQINSRIASAPSTTWTGRPIRSFTVAVCGSMPRLW